MLSKVYLALLGLSLVLMGFFSYYSWSWLQSIGLPAGAAAGYEYHARFSWTFLWISAVVLLLAANAVLWATGRAWAMWATFVYFAVMIAARFFWLDRAFLQFKASSGIVDSTFSAGPFFAVILIAITAAIVFFDQFIVSRLHRKMYPPIAGDEPVTIGEI